MSTVEEIQNAVRALSRGDFSRFEEWFAEHKEEVWDKQIEEDSKAGRLDFLIAELKDDIKNGRTIPLDQFLETIE